MLHSFRSSEMIWNQISLYAPLLLFLIDHGRIKSYKLVGLHAPHSKVPTTPHVETQGVIEVFNGEYMRRPTCENVEHIL